ncbi:MAG: hypothetical protein NW206_05200 [Hyphomonadaceae bacterium]|nr:hypothetical protein [Hyphomonadaceae bacterium]
MIKPELLLRLSGLAAVLGGLLRVISAANPPLGAQQTEALYDVIDVLLLMGLIGIYLVRAEFLGFGGLTAFAVALAALSFIGGPDADVFGFSTYQEGATVLALALAALSIVWLGRKQKPVAPPLFWLGSVVIAGVLQAVGLGDYGFIAAGVLFGLGCVAAGLDLMRPAPRV